MIHQWHKALIKVLRERLKDAKDARGNAALISAEYHKGRMAAYQEILDWIDTAKPK